MILSICDNETFVTIMNLIRIVIRIITIAVPIIMIVTLMIDITREVAGGKPDMISNVGKSAVTKVVAAIIIFLIPNFVILIARVAGKGDEFVKCINLKVLKDVQVNKDTPSGKSGSSGNNINLESAFKSLESTCNQDEYNKIYYYVIDMKESALKNQYMDRLAKDKLLVKACKTVADAERAGNYEAYYAALNEVNNLENGTIKTALLARLEKLKISLDRIKKYSN